MQRPARALRGRARRLPRAAAGDAGRSLAFCAPAGLRGAHRPGAVPAPASAPSRRSLLKGFAFGSVVTAAAAAGVTFVIVGRDGATTPNPERGGVGACALAAGGAFDRRAVEQPAPVKPSFNGRIDLAPPVVDLTAQGFTLIGGRLDYIDGKPVAVIVYRRRVHVINLFVTQGLGSMLPTPKLETFQGFNVLRWNDRGLGLMAVSDLNQEELREFAAKFEAATRAG